MRFFKNKKGLTLVEIIVALAILGIIAISFLGMFTSAITSIYKMGNNTRTVAEAQTVLDRIYEEADRDNLNTSITTIMTALGYAGNYEIVDIADLEKDYDDNQFHISIEDDFDSIEQGQINKVTLLMFYDNNVSTVKLQTPLPDLD